MSLIDEIKIDGIQEAQEILKGIGSEELFEKAHKDGDMHPNGKWVWVSSANKGKGDWRTLNGRTHKNHQANSGASSTSSSSTKTTTAQSQPKSKTSTSSITVNASIDKTQYDKKFKQVQDVIKRDGHLSNVRMGLSVVKSNINRLQDRLSDLRKNRPGAKKTIKKTEDELNLYKTNEKAINDAIEDFNSKEKANTNASSSKSQSSTKVKVRKSPQYKVKDFNASSVKKMMSVLETRSWEPIGERISAPDGSWFKEIEKDSRGNLSVLVAVNNDGKAVLRAPFEKFFDEGCRITYVRAWSVKEKNEIKKRLLDDYSYRTSDEYKKDMAVRRSISIADCYVQNDLFDKYNPPMSPISKWVTDRQLAIYSAYDNVKEHLKKWVKDNVDKLEGEDDANVKSAIVKEANNFMTDSIKNFKAGKFRREHQWLFS